MPKEINIKEERFILVHGFGGLGLVSWPYLCASWLRDGLLEQSSLLHSGQYAKRMIETGKDIPSKEHPQQHSSFSQVDLLIDHSAAS